MKKYTGITIFMGVTIMFILLFGYLTPDLTTPQEEIPPNYYNPTIWGYDTITQDTTQLDKYKVGVIDCDGDTDLQFECDTILVIATMYYPVVGQCDNSPDITADQTKIPNIDSCSHLSWIAVSQNLLWFNDGPIHYGDTVYVIAGHKTGYYIVHDAMNRRFKNKIDFLESVGTEAYKYNKAELIINI